MKSLSIPSLAAALLLAAFTAAQADGAPRPTAAAMPTIISADQIKDQSPELQKYLTDEGWKQPYIAPAKDAPRIELVDAKGAPVAASNDAWRLAGVDAGSGGWYTCWHLVPAGGGSLPKAKYLFWNWRDGAIQFNAMPFAGTPPLMPKVYKPVDGADKLVRVVRVLIVDDQDRLTYIDALPLHLDK
jgi:hypothetical protein